MAKKNDDLDFSDDSDEFENLSDYEDNITEQFTPKKDISARRRLDDLLEEKRLSRMLRDDFSDG